jgi:hypothetical protein
MSIESNGFDMLLRFAAFGLDIADCTAFVIDATAGVVDDVVDVIPPPLPPDVAARRFDDVSFFNM